MTLPAFAELTGIPVGMLRNWEQEWATPDLAASALLLILSREPKATVRVPRRKLA